MEAVGVEGLTKAVKSGRGIQEILRGINLTVRNGEVLAIMGPSGSGKSTLLGLIGGLDRPTSGHIHVLGKQLSELGQAELARFRRTSIGFVFQTYQLIPTLTALENVTLPMELAGRSNAVTEARRLLDGVGLDRQRSQFPPSLSGGEQQRVAVARAFALAPALILADEPTGNLDSNTGSQILQLMLDECRRRKAALVIVTHDPHVAARADRLVRVHDGIVVREEVPGRVAQN